MKYVIISNESEKNVLQQHFECDLYSFEDEVDVEQYDFYILLYKVNKGRCESKVESFCHRLYDKNVALIGIGNTGFDINRYLMKILKRNNSLVVYSKYCKKVSGQNIFDDISKKIVKTDGVEYSERLVGSLCRTLFRKEM